MRVLSLISLAVLFACRREVASSDRASAPPPTAPTPEAAAAAPADAPFAFTEADLDAYERGLKKEIELFQASQARGSAAATPEERAAAAQSGWETATAPEAARAIGADPDRYLKTRRTVDRVLETLDFQGKIPGPKELNVELASPEMKQRLSSDPFAGLAPLRPPRSEPDWIGSRRSGSGTRSSRRSAARARGGDPSHPAGESADAGGRPPPGHRPPAAPRSAQARLCPAGLLRPVVSRACAQRPARPVRVRGTVDGPPLGSMGPRVPPRNGAARPAALARASGPPVAYDRLLRGLLLRKREAVSPLGAAGASGGAGREADASPDRFATAAGPSLVFPINSIFPSLCPPRRHGTPLAPTEIWRPQRWCAGSVH